GFYVTSTGQEAVAASGLVMEPSDWIFPGYREHAVGLIRGFPLKDFLAQLFGNELDLLKGRQMPNHFAHRPTRYVSISSPIGTQISHAVGAAIAASLRGDKTVSIAYFGDGGTSSNDFHAGMNFAGVFRAPCIFYCSNNQFAISVPIEKQTAQPLIAQKALAYGFRGIRIDGNDPLAVYRVVKESADRAREGKGPTLIEAFTFRMGAHSSSDDPTRYCPKEKYEEWAKKDPIRRFKRYLIQKAIWSEERDEALAESIKKEINETIEEVRKASPPSLSTIFEDVYAEMPKTLALQREQLLEEARRKGTFHDTSEAFPL
ncbi:MAG: thiamine pyrophosphate-dependent enzyme, partial [Deltaproteobacteria bacterium]